MSTGIFGARAPAYARSSYSPHAHPTASGLAAPVSYPRSYASRTGSLWQSHAPYSFYPQTTVLQPPYHPPGFVQPTFVQPTCSPCLYPQPAPSRLASTGPALPAPPVYASAYYPIIPVSSGYPALLPYAAGTMIPTALPMGEGLSAHGLEAILIAILVMVSLDLIFVRPLKFNRP